LSGLFAPAWSPGTIHSFQSARLRELVRHCWREVPVYRRLWESARVDPAEFRGIEDLHRLPLMERAWLRDGALGDVRARSRQGQKLTRQRTSGHSGVPLTIWRSWFEDWLLKGYRLQSELLQGDHPFRKRFSVGGKHPGGGLRRLRTTAISHADCLDPVARMIEKLLAHDPAVVAGYSGSVAALAAALPEAARRRLRVRSVYCGAETMTPVMRETIRNAFGVGPLIVYASHEFNLIASECPKTGLLHVAHGAVVVEVLRNGQPVK
jgi:phenylacetate-CoA ligase